MAAYFFDSSALAKHYHPEVGTPEIDKIVQTPGAQVRISRLTVVELPSVFAIKVRTRFISQEDVRLLVRQFQDDIVAQKFLVAAVREPEFVAAERLVGWSHFWGLSPLLRGYCFLEINNGPRGQLAILRLAGGSRPGP